MPLGSWARLVADLMTSTTIAVFTACWSVPILSHEYYDLTRDTAEWVRYAMLSWGSFVTLANVVGTVSGQCAYRCRECPQLRTLQLAHSALQSLAVGLIVGAFFVFFIWIPENNMVNGILNATTAQQFLDIRDDQDSVSGDD